MWTVEWTDIFPVSKYRRQDVGAYIGDIEQSWQYEGRGLGQRRVDDEISHHWQWLSTRAVAVSDRPPPVS